MTTFLPILADDADLGKVIIGIIVAVVWGIGAMVSNYKKASAKERQKSWQDILKGLPANQQNPQAPRQQLTSNAQSPPLTQMTNPRPQPPRPPAAQPAKFVQNRRPPAKFAHKPEPSKRRIAPNSTEIAARVSQLTNHPSSRRAPAVPFRPAPNAPTPVAAPRKFQDAAIAHQVAGGGSHLAGGGGARIEMAGSSTQIAGGQTSPSRNAPITDALLLLKNASSIRTEFILAEILRTPVAFRDDL